ncbi:MAG: hypothetical protein ABIJ08_04060 [Nanoarchaeota archaeon]
MSKSKKISRGEFLEKVGIGGLAWLLLGGRDNASANNSIEKSEETLKEIQNIFNIIDGKDLDGKDIVQYKLDSEIWKFSYNEDRGIIIRYNLPRPDRASIPLRKSDDIAINIWRNTIAMIGKKEISFSYNGDKIDGPIALAYVTKFYEPFPPFCPVEVDIYCGGRIISPCKDFRPVDLAEMLWKNIHPFQQIYNQIAQGQRK